jgi:hypothetical protein
MKKLFSFFIVNVVSFVLDVLVFFKKDFIIFFKEENFKRKDGYYDQLFVPTFNLIYAERAYVYSKNSEKAMILAELSFDKWLKANQNKNIDLFGSKPSNQKTVYLSTGNRRCRGSTIEARFAALYNIVS